MNDNFHARTLPSTRLRELQSVFPLGFMRGSPGAARPLATPAAETHSSPECRGADDDFRNRVCGLLLRAGLRAAF